jgi:ketosteroid isomerase-like protein
LSKPSRTNLVELVKRFTDAFNREDLDEVMSFFTEEALYAA